MSVYSRRTPPLTFEETSKLFELNRITWDEYLHNLFLHCLPQHHQDVHVKPMWKSRLLRNDPFAFIVWCYQDKLTGITSSYQIEKIFHAYEAEGTAAVLAGLDELTPETARYVRASFAMWALMSRKCDLLKLTLDRSAFMAGDHFYPNRAFEDIANELDPKVEPVTYCVINTSNWRDQNEWRPSGVPDDRGQYIPIQVKSRM